MLLHWRCRLRLTLRMVLAVRLLLGLPLALCLYLGGFLGVCQVLLRGLLHRLFHAEDTMRSAVLDDCHPLAVMAQVKASDRAAVGRSLGVMHGGCSDATDVVFAHAHAAQAGREVVAGLLAVVLLRSGQ